MPPFLISIILDLVLKFGIPALVAWLKKKFNIGADSPTVSILEDYQRDAMKNPVAARARARWRLRECHGLKCDIPLKGPDQPN